MTFDYDAAEKAFGESDGSTGGNWMEEGFHVCRIDDAYTDDDLNGVPRLVVKLVEEGTGAKGQIRQSFNPDYVDYLKALVKTLKMEWKSLREVERECGALIGMRVEVESVRKGKYTNHYIKSVLPDVAGPDAPEQPEIGDDDIPF